MSVTPKEIVEALINPFLLTNKINQDTTIAILQTKLAIQIESEGIAPPEGYAIVPIEQTDAMAHAAVQHIDEEPEYYYKWNTAKAGLQSHANRRKGAEMNTDPVIQDLDRYLDEIDRSETINNRAESLWYGLERKEMYTLIGDALAELDTDDMIDKLAHVLSCLPNKRHQAVFELIESAKQTIMPYLIEKAQDHLERGLDEWGDEYE